jgi:hypothetical protein
MFSICSHQHMNKARTRSAPSSAASPATEEAVRDAEILSELAELSLELAREIQAAAVKAARAGELDTVATAETRFSHLALGIRRAIALKDRLRERREEARREAEDRRDRRQTEKIDRRHRVAQGVTRAIAATPPDAPEARERLTADLWTRLSETDRIDADLADTALPIETLVLRMCRDLGIDPALAFGPAAPVIRTQTEEPGRIAAGLVPPGPRRYPPGRYRRVPSADLGRPEHEFYMLNTDTGEIIPEPPPALPDKPADPGDTGRSPGTGDAGRSPGMPRIERCDVPTMDESEPPPEAELSADQLAEAEYRRKERERAEAWYRLRLNARIFGYG